MERQDGHDPFDPQTYYSDSNGLTIATMVELRVFCASFFESHVRHNISPAPEERMARFIKLITISEFFFARARAVIPELQIPNTVSLHENINICHILLETRRFRGPPGKRWSIHADEAVWSKLSSDGRAMLEKKASVQREQGSDVNAWLIPPTARKEVEAAKEPRKQASNTYALASLRTSTKIKPKLEIRTFITQDISVGEQLVWSPTQGTRPRQPDEAFDILASSPARSPPKHQGSPKSDASKDIFGDLSGKLTDLHTGVSLDNSTPLPPNSRALGNQSTFGVIGSGSASRNKRAPVTDDVVDYPTRVALQESAYAINGQQKQCDCHRPVNVSSGANSPVCTAKEIPVVPGLKRFQRPLILPNFKVNTTQASGDMANLPNIFNLN